MIVEAVRVIVLRDDDGGNVQIPMRFVMPEEHSLHALAMVTGFALQREWNEGDREDWSDQS